MKRLIVLILILTSCKGTQIDSEPKSRKVDLFKEIDAKVYKIDSVKNYHVIYVSSDKLNYKVISKKGNSDNCNKVELDSMYSFKIKSLILPEPRINNSNFSKPVNYDDFQKCAHMDDFTEICTEVRVVDIFESPNMFGLCYSKIAN